MNSIEESFTDTQLHGQMAIMFNTTYGDDHDNSVRNNQRIGAVRNHRFDNCTILRGIVLSKLIVKYHKLRRSYRKMH